MSQIVPIGHTNFRNQRQPFGIKPQDRLGHIYCIGKTGSGKSTLLLNMAIADIEQGNGVGIIDPHGDLAEALLEYIPEKRIQDVIYLNTTDTAFPVAYNPFSGITHTNRYITIAGIVTALKKVWADSWGPRMEHILRNTVLSLSYYSKATLLDIVPMLTNPEFRTKILYAVPEISLHDFWKKEFDPLSPQLKNEFIAPIVNKVGLFQAHPVLRNIVGQVQGNITISDVMNEGKIFIANLSKGVLGEAGTQLLGSLLVTQFQTASLARVSIPIAQRRPFYLFIDEAHSFMTKSFADVLSESRKYGLGLFITHQFMEQLDEDVLHAVIGNTGTLISFRIGARDAKVLAEEFYPIFSETDFLNLPQYHIYLRLLIDGTASKPFSATTLSIRTPICSFKSQIISYSAKRYGKSEPEIVGKIEEKYCEQKGHQPNALF
ncbi:MAG: type IV secretion system DNA-binding domain-containing protein [Chitinophagaceae bacterium]